MVGRAQLLVRHATFAGNEYKARSDRTPDRGRLTSSYCLSSRVRPINVIHLEQLEDGPGSPELEAAQGLGPALSPPRL
jgi:hypothetical protein